jgi:hypothetical protein
MPIIKTTLDGKREIQVRATLAILFSVAIIVGFFSKLVNADQFLPIVSMAITWYFAKRDSEESKKPPQP